MLQEYFEEKQLIARQISKHEILQKPGRVASKAYFVKKGLLRSYFRDEKGKDHIFMFAPEGWIISDIESHTFSVPTQLSIDALEDSEVIPIQKVPEDIYALVNHDQEMIVERLFRRISVLQRRVMLMMSASASQRYLHFLDTYPQLYNRVPLKMIASYLGMTPEALSTIRNKLKNQTS